MCFPDFADPWIAVLEVDTLRVIASSPWPQPGAVRERLVGSTPHTVLRWPLDGGRGACFVAGGALVVVCDNGAVVRLEADAPLP